MKVCEARKLYHEQLTDIRLEREKYAQRKKELELAMVTHPLDKKLYEEEAATVDLSIKALDDKHQEYMDYMEKVSETWANTMNVEVSKQQGEAMKEMGEDMMKIMEVARRIMKGGIVPPKDEQKLMNYDPKLYQMAKNIGLMARQNKERFKSLWEDEEDGAKDGGEDAMEIADNAEVSAAAPSIEPASDIAAGATVDISM